MPGLPFKLRWVLFLACVHGLGLMSASSGQEIKPMDVGRLAREAKELEQRLALPDLIAGAPDFELPLAARRHLQRRLPGVWRKLSQRLPLHVLVLSGERELAMGSPEPLQRGDAGHFVQRWAAALARQWYYTGGVRSAADPQSALTPAIHLRVIAEQGQSVVDAAAILQSLGRQAPVDLVLICHGMQEARFGMDATRFTGWLNAAFETVQGLGAELMLLAAPPAMAETVEQSLGLGRDLAQAMRLTAEDQRLLFVDLGDLNGLVKSGLAAGLDAARAFDEFSRRLRDWFHGDEQGDFLPKPALHEQLAQRLMRAMLGVQPDSWLELDGQASLEARGSQLARLDLSLRAPGAEALQSVALLPLPLPGWRPLPAPPEHELGQGKCLHLQWPYEIRNAVGMAREGEEQVLPFLALGHARVQRLDVSAQRRPLVVHASASSWFNQEREWRAVVSVLNTGELDLKGRWKAKVSGLGEGGMGGSLEIPAGGSVPLNLSFDVQRLTSSEKLRAAALSGQLQLSLDFGAMQESRQWPIWLIPNLGLEQPFEMKPRDGGKALKVMAFADPKSLRFELRPEADDLPHWALSEAGEVWRLSVGLDARSYGKRLEPGSLVPLQFSGSQEDEVVAPDVPQPWAFGTGYAAQFDRRLAKARWRQDAAGAFLQVELPRSWFYLHEWALSNGNSQVGLRLEMELQSGQGTRRWSLLPCDVPARSCEAMAVLELTREPTARFACGMD